MAADVAVGPESGGVSGCGGSGGGGGSGSGGDGGGGGGGGGVEDGVQLSAQLTHLEMECNGATSMVEISPRDKILVTVRAPPRYLVITPPTLEG